MYEKKGWDTFETSTEWTPQSTVCNDEPTTNEFKKNLTQYNCFFRMKFLSTKEVFPTTNRWNVSVIVWGQTHHHIEYLMPDFNQYPKCIQIYLMDPQEAGIENGYTSQLSGTRNKNKAVGFVLFREACALLLAYLQDFHQTNYILLRTTR